MSTHNNGFRLVYASAARIAQDQSGVDVEIGRILSQSKRNNPKRNICGALYYADGYFFQILEGNEIEVRQLYARISQDPRHEHAQILLTDSITTRSFSNWSMHFIPAKSEIRQLLDAEGLSHFTPFSFSPALTRALVDLFALPAPGARHNPPKQNGWSRFKRALFG